MIHHMIQTGESFWTGGTDGGFNTVTAVTMRRVNVRWRELDGGTANIK